MPLLIRLYQEHRQAGFEILAISINEDESRVSALVDEYKLPYPVLLGYEVGLLYDVVGVPDNIFIDRSGNIRYRKRGFRTGSETTLEAVVEELLASPPPPSSSAN